MIKHTPLKLLQECIGVPVFLLLPASSRTTVEYYLGIPQKLLSNGDYRKKKSTIIRTQLYTKILFA